MLTAAQLLAEATRIQPLVSRARHPPMLRLTGSLAVWYYCRDRTDILDRSNRVPRDIDFIYSAGGAAAVLDALEAAGYECDMRLAQETQGNRISAARDSYLVDGFEDPVILRQTLDLGMRLEACSPCISLTDLLLLKLQLSHLEQRDQIDVYALLASSSQAKDNCARLDLSRLEEVLGRSWNWWKTVRAATSTLRRNLGRTSLPASQHGIIESQLSAIREILRHGRRTYRWSLSRIVDGIVPDGNEVDER